MEAPDIMFAESAFMERVGSLSVCFVFVCVLLNVMSLFVYTVWVRLIVLVLYWCLCSVSGGTLPQVEVRDGIRPAACGVVSRGSWFGRFFCRGMLPCSPGAWLPRPSPGVSGVGQAQDRQWRGRAGHCHKYT